jgi:hypothetical protein
MMHFRTFVVGVLLIGVPWAGAATDAAAATGKAKAARSMRFAQSEPNEVDEEIATLEGELESAALDAVLIDAEPGDKVFDVAANAARAAKVDMSGKARR